MANAADNEQLIKIHRGEDCVLVFTTPSATTISGWSLVFNIGSLAGGTPTLTLTTAGGTVTITDASVGDFEVALTRAQTSALTSSEYRWDCWRVDSGYNKWLAGGKLVVLKPVRLPA